MASIVMSYTEINAKTIDQWVSRGWEWGQYVSHDEYSEAVHGRWSVKLTPVKTVLHHRLSFYVADSVYFNG